MKYSHYWQDQVKTLPVDLQKECIDYKAWKKVKQINNSIYSDLDAICNHIEKVFIKYDNHNKSSLYKFANINRQTLYKLSKRLDKHFGLNVVNWYRNNKQKYKFCGSGYKLKRLEFEINGCGECPICMEDASPETNRIMIISDCGHIICLDCFKRLYHVDKLKGEIFNLVSFSAHINHYVPNCPICRELMPVHLKEDQIISCRPTKTLIKFVWNA